MINEYIETMLEYNIKANVISRKIKREDIHKLISETLLVREQISFNIVVDAGSGNGILGIPLSITEPGKKIFMVEPEKKKYEFLIHAVEKLNLNNIEAEKATIINFFKTFKIQDSTLVARGFPDNSMLVKLLEKNLVKELILITSENKIKKIEKDIEMFEQKIYNIPSRDYIKIIKMKNVSRETLR
ncbi:MAG: RsmG family class I SAM-dependent methyltransferase [Acidobacteriota bacterium]